MRWLYGILLGGIVIGLPVPAARGQADEAALKILPPIVGFRSYVPEESPGRFKIGLWTPIAVDVQAGPLGLSNADLVVETPDSEDMATVYKVPVGALGKGERRTILAYTKPGNSEGRFNISIRQNGRALAGPMSVSQLPLDLQGRLYLTIGAKLPALQEALIALRQLQQEAGQDQNKRDSFPRYAAFEIEPARLPTLALGYDAVDLMILTTSDSKLLQSLLRDSARVKAISQWVGQGGRLVISVSWENQAEVSRLLQAPAWQPAVPVKLPAVQLRVQENATPELSEATGWAHVNNMPFPAPGRPAVPLALLQPERAHQPHWEVLAQTKKDGRPLIAKLAYGRGNITLLAFDLDKGAFTSWNGRIQFFKGLVSNLEPRIPQGAANQPIGFAPGATGGVQDLTTQLQTSLDVFDVPIIPFGWVALFIVIYILIVGPLDYFLLKRVFKRLEWTWITFPAVVLLVSAVAYFTAYAVKGRDLKVNKVDVIDFDLRTDLDGEFRTRQAHVYGQTWFTIMSPLIKSYTIGIEPKVPSWWDGAKDDREDHAVVSWLGRPETDGPAAMGRARVQGWSNRSYEYAPDGAGLKEVPIPVWTTKSFTASWDAALPRGRLPVRADLTYYSKGEGKVLGKLQSLLPVDLEDVWIIYRGYGYPLTDRLKGSKDGQATEQTVEIVEGRGDTRRDLPHWPNSGPSRPQPFQGKGFSDPTALIKDMMFHERIDTGTNQRNYNLHRLDLSWRLEEAKTGVREVILYGRLPAAAGAIENVIQQQPMPSLLWLGELSAPGKQRPTLAGTLVQDTYVRIIIPVKPGD